MSNAGSVRYLVAHILALLAIGAGCSHPREEAARAALVQAAEVLNQFLQNARPGIPDVVMNAAKCVVIIPSLPGGTAELSAPGVASCRQEADRWEPPVLINFSGRAGRKEPTTVVVFVISDKGLGCLRFEGLKIAAHNNSPAPLVSTSTVLTQLDLASDSLAYQENAGAISASKAVGIIHTNPESSAALEHSKKLKQPTAKYDSAIRSFVNTITPNGIVIHHTAIIASQTLPRDAKELDEYHQSRGFQIFCFGRLYHVAYHYLILPDGTVQPGRPERCEGAHARGYNSYLGISVVGDFSTTDNPAGQKGPPEPTEKQISALIRLCRDLRERFNIPLQHIVRHSDIGSTTCPGDRFPFPKILQELQLGETESQPQRR